jgi:UDP:flavonoid glycosyltransferase YjiC (YdhE family)
MQERFLTGLESWFTLPSQPGALPPPPYKMAVLTWVTIFPLITVIVIATAPLIGSLPVVPRLAITTLITVPVMTWVVMPRVTRLSGLPWATYCPYPPAFPSRDAPPHGLGLRPARGPLGRARDRFWRGAGDRLLRPHIARRNELRAGLGLPPLRRYEEQWLEADRFIAYTAEPYEYHRSDWPASVRLVGPGTWEPMDEAPEWLATETRPIVLVTSSTAYQRDMKLIATALQAFAGEDVALVATTAAHDPSSFTAPANARLEQFLPHRPIIARAVCVVCHGGQGTTQKALAAGVPVCVVPFSRDQFDVARRVETADAGVRLHHRRVNPARLRSAVRAATAKRSGAEAVARGFEAAGGAFAAADAVEEVLASRPAVAA